MDSPPAPDDGARPPPADPVAVADLVASVLRVPRNEVQLTAALAKLLKQSAPLRRHAVAVILGAAGAGPVPPDVDLVLDSETPSSEQRGRRQRRRLGRTDWRFRDASRPDHFDLIVEVKIDSDPGPAQFERYLRDTDLIAAAHGGLVALTKAPLRPADLPASHPKWLTPVRWHVVLPRLIVGRSAGDRLALDEAALAWNAVLGRATRADDLGQAVPDWEDLTHVAAGPRAAEARVKAVKAALEEVRAQLDGPHFDARWSQRGSAVVVRLGGVHDVLAFELGAGAASELTTRFWPPQPPAMLAGRWNDAVVRLVQHGWVIDGTALRRVDPVTRDSGEPLHHVLAAVMRQVLEPLRRESMMLDRYDAWTAPGPAIEAELQRIRGQR